MRLGPYVEGAFDGPAGAGVVRRDGVAELGGDRPADPVRTAAVRSEGDGEPVPLGHPGGTEVQAGEGAAGALGPGPFDEEPGGVAASRRERGGAGPAGAVRADRPGDPAAVPVGDGHVGERSPGAQ